MSQIGVLPWRLSACVAASLLAACGGGDKNLAALNPAASKALYFVARGDGSSQFSETLDAHNRAVNKYQRGGR